MRQVVGIEGEGVEGVEGKQEAWLGKMLGMARIVECLDGDAGVLEWKSSEAVLQRVAVEEAAGGNSEREGRCTEGDALTGGGVCGAASS
eukprot:3566020-Rhodomonas_salina.1